MEYKDLGWANDWHAPNVLVNGNWVPMFPDRTPPEQLACQAAGHKQTWIHSHNPSHCVSVVRCDICRIQYTVDSSD